MARRKDGDRPGYGKLLDAWIAPEHAGDSIGCVATSFTFSPVFFEEECLSRFLQLESDPTEDGPVYLVEREEKLAQLTCAAALVDQHHCRGNRSLRWDLISARLPRGLQHAKVSLLYWSNVCRLIIGSANLTEDGYRRNLEVFGVIDYRPNCDAPRSCLSATLTFLRSLGNFGNAEGAIAPPVKRWGAFLDRVGAECANWGVSDDELSRQGLLIRPVFSGPNHPQVFEQLREIWPGGSPPVSADVVSPFFDPPDAENAPAHELWKRLRQRGKASVSFYVTGEEVPGEEGIFLHAPESLLQAEPRGRSDVETWFHCVDPGGGRALHAKGIWLADSRWSLYQLGSSNFTSAGTGLSKTPNFEANLAYVIDSNRAPEIYNSLLNTFPKGEPVDLEDNVRWKPRSGAGEDEVGHEVLLPLCFRDATFELDAQQRPAILFSFQGSPSQGWELIVDGEESRFWGEKEWNELGRPETCRVPWHQVRPPSGFWVFWSGSSGAAWWPVNVQDGEVLPPPEELKNLPLDVLIQILSSSRPLHRVLKEYLRRREKQEKENHGDVIVDPHKRVDTSQFLLQRTRRISWALNALRVRLERPAVTVEFLRWRLRGPVGVMALAHALIREARSEAEKAFLLSELLLELSRVEPESAPGCLDPQIHREEIRQVIKEIGSLIPELGLETPENMKQYVASVVQETQG